MKKSDKIGKAYLLVLVKKAFRKNLFGDRNATEAPKGRKESCLF